MGLRAEGAALRVDPKLPRDWNALELRLRYRGVRLALEAAGQELRVGADRPVVLLIGNRRVECEAGERVVPLASEHNRRGGPA
jgi:trehalose/maltose hydrolase-like predicted phosphorylase